MVNFKIVNDWVTNEKETEGFHIKGSTIAIFEKHPWKKDTFVQLTISRELFNEMKRVFG